MDNALKKTIENIPALPGVYKMINEKEEIIYIGKAKNLKKRVGSYFKKKKDASVKTQKMVEKIHSIDYVTVDNELEAIMLETNMIKEFRPRYNVLMKDDKNFSYIKIWMQEDFPRITVARQRINDGAKYFGPKTSAYAAKETLKLLKKIFPFRHCPLKIKYLKANGDGIKVSVKGMFKYPCLDYHIKRCGGPCIGKGTKESYHSNIEQITAFLEGKTEKVTELMKAQMMELASNKQFEKAAKLRDKMQLIEKIQEKQKITSTVDENIDIINFTLQGTTAYVALFQVRLGKIINEVNFKMTAKNSDVSDAEIIESFIQDYYQTAADTPTKIMLPCEPNEKSLMQNWLSEKAGRKVHFVIPQKGNKEKLLTLALKNALLYAEKEGLTIESEINVKRIENALEKLKTGIGLKKIPQRIECYDISHLSGTMTVGSMVVFKKGKPAKGDYRLFKIRTLESGQVDDFSAMEEVLRRRLRWLSKGRISDDIKIKKPSKKDSEPLKEFLALEELGEQHYYCAMSDKKIIGTISCEEGESKSATLAHHHYGDNPELGYALLHKIINSSKARKFYLLSSKKDEPYYSQYGFQHVHKTPEQFNNHTQDQTVMIYDKNKYIIDKSFNQKPDLIVIDGGKGQLSSALKARDFFKLNIPMVSIAKREEEIFVPGQSHPLPIPNQSPENFLIQRIRDEAHRFAVGFNRELRSKEMTHSSLDEISGIGEKLKKKLLQKYGSVETIKQTTIKDLSTVVGYKTALKIKSQLQ